MYGFYTEQVEFSFFVDRKYTRGNHYIIFFKLSHSENDWGSVNFDLEQS